MKPAAPDPFPMPGHLVIAFTGDAYYGIILTADLGPGRQEWDVMLANGLTVSLPREAFRLVPMQVPVGDEPEATAACFVELVEAYKAMRPDPKPRGAHTP